MFDRVRKLLSNDIGIDLGTANTLVYLSGKGVVLNEPSVVALNEKTGQVVAVGNAAREMLGRTPQYIRAVRPLVDGVISDFEVTEEMLRYLINKAQQGHTKLLGPRVVVGVPSGITNVEIRAVRDAAKNAGARDVFIVEEPMAAAIGCRLPIREPLGTMIIDIGGGTTDIAVISLSGIVKAQSVRLAGDHMASAIVSFIRDEFKVLVGDKTAETLLQTVCSLEEAGEPIEATVRGRDLVTGLPREVVITDADVKDAVVSLIDTLIEAIRVVLETTPPEVVADIMQRGIVVTGGGSLIPGMPELLEMVIGIPVRRADEPLTSVVRGAGIILEDLPRHLSILIDHDEPVLPRA